MDISIRRSHSHNLPLPNPETATRLTPENPPEQDPVQRRRSSSSDALPSTEANRRTRLIDAFLDPSHLVVLTGGADPHWSRAGDFYFPLPVAIKSALVRNPLTGLDGLREVVATIPTLPCCEPTPGGSHLGGWSLCPFQGTFIQDVITGLSHGLGAISRNAFEEAFRNVWARTPLDLIICCVYSTYSALVIKLFRV